MKVLNMERQGNMDHQGNMRRRELQTVDFLILIAAQSQTKSFGTTLGRFEPLICKCVRLTFC